MLNVGQPFSQGTPEELEFVVANRKLAARYWTGKGTPILALHGWLDNANSFIPLLNAANAKQGSALGKRPVLALDFNSHGLSDPVPPGELMQFMSYLLDIETVTQTMGWDNYVLMGHSMGAVVSTWVAAAFPEKVEQLVAIDALGARVTDKGKVVATIRQAIEEHLELAAQPARIYASFEDAVKARMRSIFPVLEESARLLCERGMKQLSEGWVWRMDSRLRGASGVRLTKDEMIEVIEQIKCPTLFIGAKQGIAGMGHVADYLSVLPHKTEVWLEGKHHLHMDNAQAVLQAIDDFLL